MRNAKLIRWRAPLNSIVRRPFESLGGEEDGLYSFHSLCAAIFGGFRPCVEEECCAVHSARWLYAACVVGARRNVRHNGVRFPASLGFALVCCLQDENVSRARRNIPVNNSRGKSGRPKNKINAIAGEVLAITQNRGAGAAC